MDLENRIYNMFANLFGEMVYGITIADDLEDDEIVEAVCYSLGQEISSMLLEGRMTLREAIEASKIVSAYMANIGLDSHQKFLYKDYETWLNRHVEGSKKKRAEAEKEADKAN